MTRSPLSKKLGVKPGHKVLVMNGPDAYLEALGPLLLEAELATASTGVFDIVQLFVRDKSEVDQHAAEAMAALEPAALFGSPTLRGTRRSNPKSAAIQIGG